MDPVTGLGIAQIVSGFLGNLLGGGDEGPQKRRSFRGTGRLSDPVQILQQLMGSSSRFGDVLAGKAANPAPFRSSYVPNVPGLPQDPGANDSSFLNIPGLEGLDNLFGSAPQVNLPGVAKYRSRQPGASASSYRGPTRRRGAY